MITHTYEVEPCTEDESGVAPCERSEALFWSVYERPVEPDGEGDFLSAWVADFQREEDANVFATLLKRMNK